MRLFNRDNDKSERFSFALPSGLLETALVLGLMVGMLGVMTAQLGSKSRLARESAKATMAAKKSRSHRKSSLASIAPIAVEAPVPLELPVEESVDWSSNLKIPTFSEIEKQVRAWSASVDAAIE